MAKITNEIKVALLVIVAAFLLYFGFNFIKGTNIFSNQQQFEVLYKNVNGLLPGNEVKLNGLKIGRIDDAQFLEDGTYRILVTMSIDGDVKIPHNAIAQIEAADLLGEMQVNMNVSHCNLQDYQNLAKSGDQLKGDLNLGLMETVSEELMPVKGKVEALMGEMDSLLVVVNNIVAAGQIQNTLNSVETTVLSLQKMSQVMDELLQAEGKTIKTIMSNVGSMTDNLNQTSLQLNGIMDNTDKITQDLGKVSSGLASTDFESMSKQLETTIGSASETMKTLNTTLSKANDPNGSIGLLLNDKKLYNNLEKTTEDLDKLFVDLRENPKKYVQFSFIERKTKEEKEERKRQKREAKGK